MIRSLRLRLLVHTSLGAAIVLGLLGLALYLGVRRSVESEYNQSLLTEARAVAATAEQHGQQIVFDYAPDELPKFVAADHPDYFQAWIDPGVVIRSPSLGHGDLPRPPTGAAVSYHDLLLPDGRPGRMVTMSFTTTIEPNATGNSSNADSSRTVILSVASDTLSIQRTLENFRWLLAGWCCLAVVVCGAVLVWIVGRAVRPVERIASDIDQLRENDLSVRLSSGDAPTELAPVIDKLNGLLSHLESAFAREKAFTADVAHELRTPLAALLTTFEVCRSRPRDESAYVAAIDKCRDVAQRMQAMVETLLVLARADAGQLSLKLQNTDAADLLDVCWALFAPRAQARGLQLQWQVPGPIFIETDPERLLIILQNLFDNAVSYANDAGTLRVTARLDSDRLLIEVANTGSLIPPGDADQLFERFWRGDQARADTGVHCGLGLSLCQRLSRLLNGHIQVQTAQRDWFIVRLTLPAPSRDPRPRDFSIPASMIPPASAAMQTVPAAPSSAP
ncbi:MAG: ATP-binding protein [Tepidisphaeraceae bacterium]|jgi:two-component system, OmpR family, heavy metal sensor histidine kinase CusS